jgi:hypothetical protein
LCIILFEKITLRICIFLEVILENIYRFLGLQNYIYQE